MLLTMKVTDIAVLPNRQRQAFDEDALRDLGESIERNGLFNALTVRPARESDGVKELWVLMQGERRWRAIKDYVWPLGGSLRYGTLTLEEGTVPVVRYHDLDPIQAEEAELEENIKRANLTWQEQSLAHARLANLRLRQSQIAGGDAPTVADIALEVRGSTLGSAHEATRREILIAPHLKDPEVAKAKTLDEGWKALVVREQKRTNEALALSVGRVFTASVHELYHGDCIPWMEQYSGEGFDVICTDPPYGIDADQFGDAGGRLVKQTHVYDDSFSSWIIQMQRCAALWFKVAKPQSHIYVCCDIDNFGMMKDFMREAGWRVHRTPIVNYKVDGNRIPWPAHGPQRKWEMTLYAIKGDKPTTGVFPDLFETRGDPNLGHGAQKPTAFFSNLLRRSVQPGNSVLDTFMGTGSALISSHELKCKFVGIDVDAISYGIALNRLQNLKGLK